MQGSISSYQGCVLSSLLVLLTSHPHDQPGQLWLLPGASSGYPVLVPSVQDHWPVVVQAVSQQLMAVVGREAYQLAPFRDIPCTAHIAFVPCIFCLVPNSALSHGAALKTCLGHVLGPSGYCCPLFFHWFLGVSPSGRPKQYPWPAGKPDSNVLAFFGTPAPPGFGEDPR